MAFFAIDPENPPVYYNICVAFELTSILLIFFVFALSLRRGRNFNWGPRIFTINLMIFDLVHSLCALFIDSDALSQKVAPFLIKLGVYWPMSNYSFTIQSWVLLVFNASFVPMMSMSILATTSSYGLTSRSSALYFVAFILLSDFVPTVYQVLNVKITGNYLASSPPYACASYILYATQLLLTVIALRILFRKRSEYLDATVKTNRRNLTNIVLFSIAPCLIQAPFALQQLTRMLRWQSEFWARVDLLLFAPVKIMFALKPAIDAISILLFLGEYRQMSLSGFAAIKIIVTRSTASFTKVTHVRTVSNNQPASSVLMSGSRSAPR